LAVASEPKKQFNCAIYTRKSSEEGLEQEFNSLDAQREACEAYVRSQRHEGWRLLETQYDDGGFSGGNMERPGLVKLLADIRARKIDVVVVYKVDRLTRALSDFAKIVETFDAQGVSFVSVTQQFNTTSSMGRLTLNVLLSFAQFEREVTGERIRDKIAASRRKGMWMGGNIPLGYDLDDHKLVINKDEAETVRLIFRLYVELNCVRKLKAEVERRGLATKRWISGPGRTVGGESFSRGHLYYLLRNRVYLGDAVHRGTPHPGQHASIIDQKLWDQAQAILENNRVDRKQGKGFTNPSQLAGIMFDDRGNRLTPSHTGKKGARYRYYVSQAILQNEPDKVGAIKRVPAHEIEGLVHRRLIELLRKSGRLVRELCGEDCDASTKQALIAAAGQRAAQMDNEAPIDLNIRSTLSKIIVGPDSVEIVIDRNLLKVFLQIAGAAESQGNEPPLVITIPVRIKRSGRPGKMLISEFDLDDSQPQVNVSMVKAIGRAHKWDRELRSGKSINEIAKNDSVHRSYVGQVLPLAFLAPDIVEAILDGRQPRDLKVEQLLRSLPINWTLQRQVLGFQAQ